ncbi:hypothetical protein MKW98_027535, partial [Papaver atlanticum]
MGVNATIIVHVCNLKFSHIVTSSSTINELKLISDLYFTYVYEGNNVCLRGDFQLQSMICFYIVNNVITFDLSIEFISYSSLAASVDYDGDVVDELAEDSRTAFIEDEAQVSRPRRLKEWENVLGDVSKRSICSS